MTKIGQQVIITYIYKIKLNKKREDTLNIQKPRNKFLTLPKQRRKYKREQKRSTKYIRRKDRLTERQANKMDPFESNEPIRFTQVLREKLKQQRSGNAISSNVKGGQPDRDQQLQMVRLRNIELKKMHELSKQGVVVDVLAYEPEASLMRTMSLSKSEKFRELYKELLQQCRPFDNPKERLSKHVFVARILKFCLFKGGLKSVSPKSIERAYLEFTDSWEGIIRNPEKRDALLLTCRQIHSKRGEILDTGIQKDHLEKAGFSYSDSTFDDLFVNGWSFGTGSGISGQNALKSDILSTDSSSDETVKESSSKNTFDLFGKSRPAVNTFGDDIDEDIVDIPTNGSSATGHFGSADDIDEETARAIAEAEAREEKQIDMDTIEPSKINQFKYILDKFLQKSEDEGSALNTIDGYANLLSIILSNKSAEEIQEELINLVGIHNFELLMQLMERRELIKDQIGVIEEVIKKEKANENYKPKNFEMQRPGGKVGVSVEFVKGGVKGKKGRKVQNMQQYEQKAISNYDILQKLGFDTKLIGENKQLGLKEKTMNNLNQYLMQHQRDVQDDNVVIERSREQQAQIYKAQATAGKSTIKTEENDDWKFIEITPPPKEPQDKGKLVKIDSLPKFAQGAFSLATHLNQIQTIVYPVAFKQSRNLLVAAPTGAGKTNIALLTILREVSLHIPDFKTQQNASLFNMKEKQFKIIYIAPLKALASEIVEKFSTALGYLGIRVRELTGDMSMTKQEIQECHIIVSTPEKWDVVTRKTDGMMNLVNCMIIDEIHLLNDERGLVLECLVSRALTTGFKNQKPIRLVGLSATLPNYLDVADFIGCDEQGVFAFDASYRPTPLKCSFYGIKEMGNAERGNNIMNDIILDELGRILAMGKQVIIFVHQRAATYNTAMEVIELLKKRPKLQGLFVGENAYLAKKQVDKSHNTQVKELFPHGFSVHHAGMLRKDRNMVENMFHNGDIKVLCSTSTLAWGVNLPAYAVLIKGTKVYDSSAGAYKDVGVFDVQQIFGRAGRPQYDNKGEAIILTPYKQVDEYVKMMQNKQNIESHLDKGLNNCLNAEIASGTITTISEGIQWLKKSYYYQRMVKNPHNYGVSRTDLENDPSGHMVLLKKIHDVVDSLNQAHLIRFNRDTEQVYSTDMGRIASNYYINVETMSYFMANLKPNTREDMILYHLSQASEFKQLDARKEEQNELKVLVTECQIVDVDKTLFNEAHTKVQVLFEAYLKNRQLKTFSLISDMAYVVQNSARLLRAMFEIALQRNYAGLMKSTLAWCQILDKRLLPDSHTLRQFTSGCSVGKLTNQNSKVTRFGYLRDDIVYRLEQFNVSMDDIYDHKLEEASRYLPPGFRDEMNKFASFLPRIEMDLSVQPITRTILKVQLTLTAEFNWNDRWNGNSEPFWILVDNDTEVLHQEFFQLQKKDVKLPGQRSKGIKNEDATVLTFFIPYQVPEGETRIAQGNYYSLEIISDRWYNLSFFAPIELADVCVPDEDYPHTKLLPLRPMAVTALGEPSFESLYRGKFDFFNPIQTQVFHTLFHTDSNVLIGAPTGSGKTIMSELAMLRVFKQHPGKKVIYIAPLKALAKERIIDWKVRMGSQNMKKSVLELTGDCTPDLLALKEADLLITTPEKWDGISRNWQHRSYVSEVALVVIDEIHLLGQDRGPVIEVIVSRMRYIAEQTGSAVRFVGLSTALANAKDVADWLGIHRLGLFNFKPSVRPVPIKVFFEGFPEKHYCPRMATMNKPSFKAIMTHARGKPTLVFVSSRRQTRLTALDLIALCAADQQEKIASDGGNGFLEFKKPFLNMDEQEISVLSEFIKDENLRHTIQFGVGMHHAGLEEGDRKIVEDLFVKKKIQVLVTTSTLAWGVNFPARLVVVKGTEFFDPAKKRYVDFPLTDLLQMIGRAGRPGMDDHGVACVMVHEEKKNFYKKFLYEPFPVESSLANSLTDHLNAEIASGTLTSRKHCIDYLTWTYFFRRLTKNPTFYNLDGNDANAINKYLLDLVNLNLVKLREAGCVELSISDDVIAPTQLGFLASFYYMSHISLKHIRDNLRRDSSIDDLIDVLSKCQEFAGLPVRHNEDVLNEALAHIVPIKVPKHDLESPHVKANLLLQAHFGRSPLPITDFITDTKSVLDQSIRVLQGMLDVAAHKGLLQTALNIINLLQMLVQGQWLNQSPLLNVPHLSQMTIGRLNRMGICHLVQLIEAHSEQNLEKVLRKAGSAFTYEEISEIKKALDRVPMVQMRWNIVKVNEINEPQEGKLLEEGGEAQFTINLKRVNKSNSQALLISNYPKYKESGWFILVANPVTDELLVLKRLTFKRFTSKELVAILPEDFTEHPKMKIYLMSDSYIGLDQEYTIDLNKVNEIIGQRALEMKELRKQNKSSGDGKVKIQIDLSAKGKGQDEEMAQFQDYSDIKKSHNPSRNENSGKPFGKEKSELIRKEIQTREIDTDQNQFDEGSESSDGFDVQADDIYDLTVF